MIVNSEVGITTQVILRISSYRCGNPLWVLLRIIHFHTEQWALYVVMWRKIFLWNNFPRHNSFNPEVNKSS